MDDIRSIFITTSNISIDNGGGNICYHIIQALQKSTSLIRILCNGNIDIVKTYNINPVEYSLPDNPFLWDYLASRHLPRKLDIAHFYGNPFGVTVDLLRNMDTKIIVDVPAHNLDESIREFELWGLEYPYKHMTDETLWKYYIQHIVNADIIITPSKYSADYISLSDRFKKYFLHKPSIKIIPHGCNPPGDLPVYPNKFIVGHLGQNGLDKGQIYLLQASQYLRDKNIKIIIAGDRTEYWKPAILENKLPIEVQGRINDIDSFYRNISIYIQPSVCDGFGIPVLEAMSYGRPVIVTEGVGAKDLVVDGFNGFIVPIRSPELLAEKVNYFYENPGEIQRMGLNAHTTALNYSWDKIVERYQVLYSMF